MTEARSDRSPLTVRQRFLVGFVGVIAIGFVLLQWTGLAEGAPASTWHDHLFTSVSAVSTTGLTTINITEAYSSWGQVLVLLLFQVGGLGYILIAAAISVPEGELSDDNEDLVKVASYIPDEVEAWTFLRLVVAFTFVAEGIGTLLLAWGFRQNGLAWGEALWQGLFHSVSAFCTAGFGLYGDSLQGFSDSPLVVGTVLALAILGGVGVLGVAALYARQRGEAEHLDYMAKAVLWAFGVLFVGGWVLFATTSETTAATDYPLLNAAFLCGTALTGAGFSTVSTGALQIGVLTAVTLPACAGSAPTGTSGGIKLSNISVAAAVLAAQRSEEASPSLFGKALDNDTIRTSLSTIVCYLTLVFVGINAALYMAPDLFAVEDLLFEVVSALGTVGLSRGITGDLTEGLKLLLVALMFVGRVGVLTLALGVVRK